MLGPAAMAWAVVATANHYVVDVAAGAAVVLLGLAVVVAGRRVRVTLSRLTAERPPLSVERARLEEVPERRIPAPPCRR